MVEEFSYTNFIIWVNTVLIYVCNLGMSIEVIGWYIELANIKYKSSLKILERSIHGSNGITFETKELLRFTIVWSIKFNEMCR